MALHFLDLLQYEHFRREMTNSNAAKFVEDQQLLHWQHYIRKRTMLLQQNQTGGSGATIQEQSPAVRENNHK
jgi:mediator of RNA polymerase II transcription subunit 31